VRTDKIFETSLQNKGLVVVVVVAHP